METRKKGFVLYFDNYPMLVELAPEQVGWLSLALFRYADWIWQDETVTQEGVLDLYPQMEPQTRMAFGFMAGNILRDTDRWWKHCQARQERKEGQAQSQRSTQAFHAPRTEELPDPGFLEDTARTKRLLERLRMAE